jgi:DNA polymerase-3 subunit delta'
MSERAKEPDSPDSDAYEGAPHPRFAKTLVGHRDAELALLNAYRQGRLAHAWLIGGKPGIGKATLAWRFARFALAYPDPSGRAVREAADLFVPQDHPASKLLAANAHPDFALLRREWNPKAKVFYTEIRIDDVRDRFGVFHLSAAFGGWRIAIVDSADDLNKASANALLKMIEEPPPRSLILIVAHRPGQVLATIRSRCRKLMLEPLTPAEIEEVIATLGAPWSAAGRERIAAEAHRSDGSVRETLRRLDPAGREVGALIDAAIAGLPRPDPDVQLRLAEAVNGRAAEDAFERFTLAIFDWLAAEAHEPSSPARLEAIAGLWRKLRDQTRDTLTLNLDKRLHVIALFDEIRIREKALRL